VQLTLARLGADGMTGKSRSTSYRPPCLRFGAGRKELSTHTTPHPTTAATEKKDAVRHVSHVAVATAEALADRTICRLSAHAQYRPTEGLAK
jgi:hypothetical protein